MRSARARTRRRRHAPRRAKRGRQPRAQRRWLKRQRVLEWGAGGSRHGRQRGAQITDSGVGAVDRVDLDDPVLAVVFVPMMIAGSGAANLLRKQ